MLLRHSSATLNCCLLKLQYMLNYDYKQSDLSRSVLGGLFSGIVATVLNMIFVYAYRFISGFEDFQGFDLTVIVFGTLLLSLASGVVFYFFVHFLRRGVTIYRIAVLIITILIISFGLMLRQSIR